MFRNTGIKSSETVSSLASKSDLRLQTYYGSTSLTQPRLGFQSARNQKHSRCCQIEWCSPIKRLSDMQVSKGLVSFMQCLSVKFSTLTKHLREFHHNFKVPTFP